jgi:hypothetical protein
LLARFNKSEQSILLCQHIPTDKSVSAYRTSGRDAFKIASRYKSSYSIKKEVIMKHTWTLMLGALLISGHALAADSNAKTAVGGGLGAAAGTALGGVVGGSTGEVVGGAVGGGLGGAVTTKGEGQAGAVIGGAAGGAGGAYVGRKVSGSGTGAVVGAGLGGAGGAVVGKVIDEPAKGEKAYNKKGNSKHKHKHGKGHYKHNHQGHDD